jgi:hypothetical protein
MRPKRQAEALLMIFELLGEVQKQLLETANREQRERTIWNARRGIWFAKKALARANSNVQIERALKHLRIWEQILLHTKGDESGSHFAVSGSGPNWKGELTNLYKTIRQKIEALPETVSKEDVLKLLEECEPEEPATVGFKPMILIQMLAEMEANPDDPRVVRLFELSVKTREHTLTEEEKLERLRILEALVQEARAKGKAV